MAQIIEMTGIVQKVVEFTGIWGEENPRWNQAEHIMPPAPVCTFWGDEAEVTKNNPVPR